MREEKKAMKNLPVKYVGSVGFNQLAAQREHQINHGFSNSPNSNKKYPKAVHSTHPKTKQAEIDPFNPFADPVEEPIQQSPNKISKTDHVKSFGTPEPTKSKIVETPSTPFDDDPDPEDYDQLSLEVQRPKIFQREEAPKREQMQKLSHIITKEYNDLFTDDNLAQMQEAGMQRQNIFSSRNNEVCLDIDPEDNSSDESLDLDMAIMHRRTTPLKVMARKTVTPKKLKENESPEKSLQEDWRITAAKQQTAFNPFVNTGYEMSVVSNEDTNQEFKVSSQNIDSNLKMF